MPLAWSIICVFDTPPPFPSVDRVGLDEWEVLAKTAVVVISGQSAFMGTLSCLTVDAMIVPHR